MEDSGPYGSFCSVTGPTTMLTQLQNSYQICFVASSGPSNTTQPHAYWLLSYDQADALAAERPVKKRALEGSGPQVASVVWWLQLPRLLHF